MKRDTLLTTVPDETVRQRLDRHAAYLQALAMHLIDLQPVVGDRTLSVATLTVWLDTEPYNHQVMIDTGHWRRGSRRRFRQTDAKYIAKQVRRIMAEQTEKAAAQKAYQNAVTAQCEREEAVKAPAQALADRLNQRALEASNGVLAERPVRELQVYEATAGESRSYSFDLRLQALTEAQVLAILQIVERGVFLAEVER